MAVSSLKIITKAIITLLTQGFSAHGMPNVKVFSDPPSKDKENGISFYMFHIQESAHHKNFPAPGTNQPPIRFSPMGLNLYYQLTANFDKEEGTGEDAYEEQDMMGVAMKILHDYPEINDDTSITTNNGVINIFDAANSLELKNKGNRIKISLLPVNYNESVHYWTAGQEPMKLSAYYEVSMIFLEPEPTTTHASPVLQYSITMGSPRITGSQSKYTLSGKLISEEVISQPAQTIYGGRVDFLGTGFKGSEVELLIFSSRWPQPMKITRTTANWQLVVNGDNRVTLIVDNNINGTPLLFGLYAAQINVVRQQRFSNGQVRNINISSNRFPFTIIPQIDVKPVPVNPNDIVTVEGKNIGHSDVQSDIRVLIGYDQYTPDGNLPEGTFRRKDDDTLEIKLHAGLSAGILPLRILIAGAESAPSWVTIP